MTRLLLPALLLAFGAYVLYRTRHAGDREHMRALAHRYALRAEMDGTVLRGTGEIVPRESA